MMCRAKRRTTARWIAQDRKHEAAHGSTGWLLTADTDASGRQRFLPDCETPAPSAHGHAGSSNDPTPLTRATPAIICEPPGASTHHARRRDITHTHTTMTNPKRPLTTARLRARQEADKAKRLASPHSHTRLAITEALRRPYGSYPERIHKALATLNHAIRALPGAEQPAAQQALLDLLNWMDDGGAQ